MQDIKENYIEWEYQEILYTFVERSKKEQPRTDRTGTGTYSDFFLNLNHNVSKSYPLFTTKKVWFKGIFEELKWFLSGSSNVNDLPEDVRKLWDSWSKSDGDLGITYGVVWRRLPYILNDGLEEFDQIKYIIDLIKNDPTSRRILFNGWNTPYHNQTGLSWCHGSVCQFYVNDGKLSLYTHQRSCDIFLGFPFNIASYALFLEIIANVCDLKPGMLHYTLGDYHLYSNHVEQAKIQMNRELYELPKLVIKRKLSFEDLWNLDINDFEVVGYNHHPSIPAPVSV